MTGKTYKVVFSGETVAGVNPETVKQNLRVRFKFDEETMSRLFSGEQVTIRKRLDITSANKYVSAFRQAGAICNIVEKPLKAQPVQQELDNNFLFTEEEPRTVIIDTLAEVKNSSTSNPFLSPAYQQPEKNDDFPRTVVLNTHADKQQTGFTNKTTASPPPLELEGYNTSTNHPSASNPFMASGFTCPKCGKEQDKNAACISCGIVFAKFQKNSPYTHNSASSTSSNPLHEIYASTGNPSSRSPRRRRNRTSIREHVLGFVGGMIQDWFKGHIYVAIMILVLLPLFGGGLIINAVFYTKDHHVLYEISDRSLACGDLKGDPNLQSTFTLMDNHQKDYMLVSHDDRDAIIREKGSQFCIYEHKITLGNIGDEEVNYVDLIFSSSKIDQITLDSKTLNHTRERILDISADSARAHDPDIKHINPNQIRIEKLAAGTLIHFNVIGWYQLGTKPLTLSELIENSQISEGTIEEGNPRATVFARFVSAIF